MVGEGFVALNTLLRTNSKRSPWISLVPDFVTAVTVAPLAAVNAFTVGLARQWLPRRIRVNAVAPGMTDTAQPRYGNSDEELVEMARTTIPLGGKLLTPDQVARTAVFLASDEASAVTGQVLHVNGGSYMP